MKKGLSIILCLVMILSVFTVVPFGVSANSEYSEIRIGETRSVNIKGYHDEFYLKFVPDQNTDVVITCQSDSLADFEISGTLFDTNMNYLDSHSAYAKKGFRLAHSVLAGQTYYLYMNFFYKDGGNIGLVNISLAKPSLWEHYGSTLTRYNGKAAKVTIPSALDGKTITAIGDYAFYGCESLTSISIPKTVTSIGDYAFFGCVNLSSIPIPDSVTSIGSNALNHTAWFAGQPDGLVYAGKVAFKVKNDYNGELTIKDGTVSISPAAFNFTSGLTGVVIPDSVASIGYRAFYDCDNLKQVTFGNGLETIDYWAFYNCGNLTSVTLPATVTEIGDRAFGYYYHVINYTDYGRIDDFKIYGYDDTAAEKYASENRFTFISLGKSKSLAAPKLSMVQNTAAGVSVAWGKSAGAAKYRVFRKSGSDAWAKLTDTTALSIVDKTAKSGTKYAYTVRCISKDSKSYTSDYDKTGKSILYLAQPKITKSENVAKGVKLTLSKSAGADAYKIFIKSGKAWKLLATVKTNTYTHTKVKSGTTYTYTVRAVDKTGKALSAYDTKGWSLKYLAQPKITKFENVANGIKLTLSKSAGAASYKVFIKSGRAWKLLATVKTNTYTYTKVKSGTAYTFTVRAVDKSGKTLSAYNTTGWKQKFVASPALPTLKNTKNGVQVTIKKVAGAEKYRIFRKEGKGKLAKLADTAKLTYVDKTAKNGKTYAYTVRCISKNGKAYTSAYNTAGKSIKCKR